MLHYYLSPEVNTMAEPILTWVTWSGSRNQSIILPTERFQI